MVPRIDADMDEAVVLEAVEDVADRATKGARLDDVVRQLLMIYEHQDEAKTKVNHIGLKEVSVPGLLTGSSESCLASHLSRRERIKEISLRT